VGHHKSRLDLLLIPLTCSGILNFVVWGLTSSRMWETWKSFFMSCYRWVACCRRETLLQGGELPTSDAADAAVGRYLQTGSVEIVTPHHSGRSHR